MHIVITCTCMVVPQQNYTFWELKWQTDRTLPKTDSPRGCVLEVWGPGEGVFGQEGVRPKNGSLHAKSGSKGCFLGQRGPFSEGV